MNPYYRPALEQDVEFVAPNLRTADIQECEAAGFNALDALWASFHASEVCYFLHHEGDPVGITGVCPSPLGPEFGTVWMMGTDKIKHYRSPFLRSSKQALDDLFEASGRRCLHNITWSGNTLHHRWLKHLGFTFLPTITVPPSGETFIPFAKLKE